jgi:hypothetical protein
MEALSTYETSVNHQAVTMEAVITSATSVIHLDLMMAASLKHRST